MGQPIAGIESGSDRYVPEVDGLPKLVMMAVDQRIGFGNKAAKVAYGADKI